MNEGDPVGFATVAWIDHGQSYRLAWSPRTVTWLLCHPPTWVDDGLGDAEPRLLAPSAAAIARVARRFHEPVPPRDGLLVQPTFYAQDRRFFTAWQNQIDRLEPAGYKTFKGRRYVLLPLPQVGR